MAASVKFVWNGSSSLFVSETSTGRRMTVVTAPRLEALVCCLVASFLCMWSCRYLVLPSCTI